jgi:hypothetical protein
VVLVFGLAAWGQPTVPVTVVVKDPSGGFVPRAAVAFSQSTSSAQTDLQTDTHGRATAELAPGNYELSVEVSGFKIAKEPVEVTGAAAVPVMLALEDSCPPCQRVVRMSADYELPIEVPVLTEMIQSAQAPAPTPGYTPVTVVVTDSTGAAVAGAEIRVTPGSPAGDKLIADEQGRAQLGMPAGEYKLHVSAEGFVPVEKAVVVAGGPRTVTVSLVAAPTSSGAGSMAGPAPMSPGAVPLGMGEGNAASAGTQPAGSGAVLTILGANGERGVFTPQTLSEYPQTKVTVFDPHAKKQVTYAGVPLVDLLAKLGVKRGKDLMGKALGQYVVATGSDGYVSVVALGEVDPAFHPGTVLVADAMDGKPLDAKVGPFRLVVSEDKKPARSVRNLVRIEVRSAE